MWPVPAKKMSACCGFTAIDTFMPLLSISAGSVNAITGAKRVSEDLAHGTSVVVGSENAIIPIAPAAFKAFQRSAAVCEWAARGAGTFRRRSRETKSDLPFQIDGREIMDLCLGNRQTVAGEYDFGFDLSGLIDAYSKRRFFPELNPSRGAIRYEIDR